MAARFRALSRLNGQGSASDTASSWPSTGWPEAVGRPDAVPLSVIREQARAVPVDVLRPVIRKVVAVDRATHRHGATVHQVAGASRAVVGGGRCGLGSKRIKAVRGGDCPSRRGCDGDAGLGALGLRHQNP